MTLQPSGPIEGIEHNLFWKYQQTRTPPLRKLMFYGSAICLAPRKKYSLNTKQSSLWISLLSPVTSEVTLLFLIVYFQELVGFTSTSPL